MLVDQDFHEVEFKGKSDIYIGTTPDKITITQEEMAFQTTKNHGILNTGICLIEDKEEKNRGLDVESTARKTKCRRQ
jgi:hypothetical protein